MTRHLILSEDFRFSIAMFWCVVGFVSYYFLSKNRTFRQRSANLFKILDGQGNQVMLQRMAGLLFLGLLTALIILSLPDATLKEYGLSFHFQSAPPWWYWLLIPLIISLAYITGQNETSLEQYPQIRTRLWTPRLVLLNGVSWLLFLVGYEFMFRGFLLHASLGSLEPVPAVALNCALYSFAHLYKGSLETLGAIPAGIVFCYITIVTGNIWCAVLIHSVMALSNEWFALRAHPDMKLLKRS